MKKKGVLPDPNSGMSAALRTILASVISIIIGLAVGSIIVLVVGLTSETLSASSAWDGIKLVCLGIFSTGRSAAGQLTFGFNPTNVGDMLFRATPLIMTGLSVAVAFKTGLFNIGAPGQYLMGTAATLFIALSIPTTSVPAWLVWILAFLGGMAAGAVWGAIPGLVKAYLNINEVLACIMTNWIAANVVTWFFDMSNLKNVVESSKTGYIYKTTFNGVATPKAGLDSLFPGSQVNMGILIAIVIAILMYILMAKTTLGYELKACGSNRHAAHYAGIKDKRNIVLSMAISGALAGLGGFVYALTTANCSANGDVAGFGFLALAVMIFGNWKPLNIAGASLLFGLFKCIAASYSTIDINGDGVFLLGQIGISPHFYRMLPYLITLIVLAFTSKSSRAPKAEGIPYDKAKR